MVFEGIEMIVMKFGGTSLADAERIKNISNIIKGRLDKNPIVVVSAIGGITDLLLESAKEASKGANPNEKVAEIINIHKEVIRELGIGGEFLVDDFVMLHDVLNGIYLLKELSLRSIDLVASFGEIFSSKILTRYLNNKGTEAKQYSDVGIITNNNFTNAEIAEETYENIKAQLSGVKHLPVVAGFIAKNKDGEITTLGRGGSDYTASIIGAGLDAEEIEIWTDVDGIKTADPNIVKNASQWNKLTFNEASEMAFFGAKILHPKTIKPAINKSIPVRILNTYNAKNEGTLIVKESEEIPLRSISLKKDISVVRICSTKMLMAYGFLSKIFDVFNKYKISVDLVSTSEVTVSMTLDKINNNSDLENAISELENLGNVEVLKKRSIVCIVGNDIRNKVGILGRIFNTCKNTGVNVEMVSQGASPLSISFVVNQDDSEKIVKELHKELFE